MAFRALVMMAIFAPSLALAHEGHGKAAELEKLWKAMQAKPPIAVGASFDSHGVLWLAQVNNGFLTVSKSTDLGKRFGKPVKVNTTAEFIAADGENRPKIRIATNGNIYLSYTQGLAKPMTGNIRFSRSIDGGKRFSKPVTVNDNHDIISHRFDALNLAANGEITVAWLDKRDLQAAKAKGAEYSGAAVYYARSNDQGASFQPNQKLVDHACECCRVAIASDRDGTPVVAWRHVFDGNIRDHAILRLDGKSSPQRLSNEQWQVDACPHHGPSLSIDSDGSRHAVWFSNSPAHAGLFYARAEGENAPFSSPIRFGNPDAQASHPEVLAASGRVVIVWKEFDGQQSLIQAMASADAGLSWKTLPTLASTASKSDHPQLIRNPVNGKVYLVWNAAQQGLRLIEVAEQ